MNIEKRIQVLLVDDDSEFLKTTKEAMNQLCNFDIELAESADVAFEKMVEKEYDVIVCDVQMPKTGGFEFLKIIRESEIDLPFIILTVTEDKETALKSFRLGADGFVGKFGEPEVVFSTLIKCIREVNLNKNDKRCD